MNDPLSSGQIRHDTEAMAYLGSLIAQYISQGLTIRQISRRFDEYIEDIRNRLQPGGTFNPSAKQILDRVDRQVDRALAQAFPYQVVPLPAAGRAPLDLEAAGIALKQKLKKQIKKAEILARAELSDYEDQPILILAHAINQGSPSKLRAALEGILLTLDLPILSNHSNEAHRKVESIIDEIISEEMPMFSLAPVEDRTHITEKRFREYLRFQLGELTGYAPFYGSLEELYRRIKLGMIDAGYQYVHLLSDYEEKEDPDRVIREEIEHYVTETLRKRQ